MVTGTVGYQMSSADTEHQQRDIERMEKSRLFLLPEHVGTRNNTDSTAEQGRWDFQTQISTGPPLTAVGLQLWLVLPKRTRAGGVS